MRSLRRTIQLKEGVKVNMLFTPHLFSFKGLNGLTFDSPDANSPVAVFESYADIMYAAALNAFVLDCGGSVDDFEHTRGDFHEYMALNAKEFAQDVDFAVEALTGKRLKDLAGAKSSNGDKKKVSPLTGILSRAFS